MRRILVVRELRDRLISADHLLAALNVLPCPNTHVTVGLNLDPTLKPEYRERYFACLLESQDNPVPIVQYDAAFALSEPFRDAAEQSLPASDFMDGPFRWLLHRLLRFRSMLLWPANCPEAGWIGLLEERPRLGEWLRDATVAPFAVGAIVLNSTDARDCAVLWEVAKSVSDSFIDWYVSDPECNEVYRLHHHDKIEASVPNPTTREKMLQELAERDDVIEDCSGYDFEMAE
jgi:hypothetical protein